MGSAKSSLSSRVTPVDGETRSRHFRGSTAVTMEYEMWCLPASEFLLLSKLRPHEELLAEGKLVQWDASRTTVFYVSHQWTSTNHPDYSTDQLRTFQSLLLRMIRGTVPETAPTFVDAVRLPSNVKISTQQWQTLVQDAVVWMDYLSVRAYCCCHTVALSSFPPVRYSSYIFIAAPHNCRFPK